MRLEKDSMGTREVPDQVYWGIQTLRAVENFPISGLKPQPLFVHAMVLIKKAAAQVNQELGCIPPQIAGAIIQSCDQVLAGELADQFVVDVFQAGAGTSFHMNVNEVLANRSLELLGHPKGVYEHLSPNDHVNYGQSTNDVIPTAIRIAAILALRDFLPVLEYLAEAFEEKGEEFLTIVKAGRTHLQDAVPVRLGEEFRAYAQILKDHVQRVEQAALGLRILGIGGSAVGTGLNTHPLYAPRMAEVLSVYVGLTLEPAPHLMASMMSLAPFVHTSGTLRNLAQDLTKIANDLRLMDSGPTTGLKEIKLPPVQPGSSIMPGKYNPVMAEMLNMVCYQVMGLDQAIMLAAQAGQLELNVMMPLVAYDLLYQIQILTNSLTVFRTHCVEAIEANPERCLAYAEGSLSLVTALNIHIGYLKAAEVAKESLETGMSIPKIVLAKGYLSEEKLSQVLNLMEMSELKPQQEMVGAETPTGNGYSI
jgi:aspartate ammonia-lyase